jgi:hypothetical protein
MEIHGIHLSTQYHDFRHILFHAKYLYTLDFFKIYTMIF